MLGKVLLVCASVCLSVVNAQETECSAAGSLVGAVFGSIFATLLVVFLLYVWWQYRKSGSKTTKVYATDYVDGTNNNARLAFRDAETGVEKELAPEKGDVIYRAKKRRSWFPSFKSGGQRQRSSVSTESLANIKEIVKVPLKSQDFTGLGFTVSGNMRDGIFVSDVYGRGPATESGQVAKGDRLVSLKVSFDKMVFEDALTILSYSSPYAVVLELEKEGAKTVGVGAKDATALLDNVRLHPLLGKVGSLDDSYLAETRRQEQKFIDAHRPASYKDPVGLGDVEYIEVQRMSQAASLKEKKMASDDVAYATIEASPPVSVRHESETLQTQAVVELQPRDLKHQHEMIPVSLATVQEADHLDHADIPDTAVDMTHVAPYEHTESAAAKVSITDSEPQVRERRGSSGGGLGGLLTKAKTLLSRESSGDSNKSVAGSSTKDVEAVSMPSQVDLQEVVAQTVVTEVERPRTPPPPTFEEYWASRTVDAPRFDASHMAPYVHTDSTSAMACPDYRYRESRRAMGLPLVEPFEREWEKRAPTAPHAELWHNAPYDHVDSPSTSSLPFPVHTAQKKDWMADIKTGVKSLITREPSTSLQHEDHLASVAQPDVIHEAFHNAPYEHTESYGISSVIRPAETATRSIEITEDVIHTDSVDLQRSANLVQEREFYSQPDHTHEVLHNAPYEHVESHGSSKVIQEFYRQPDYTHAVLHNAPYEHIESHGSSRVVQDFYRQPDHTHEVLHNAPYEHTDSFGTSRIVPEVHHQASVAPHGAPSDHVESYTIVQQQEFHVQPDQIFDVSHKAPYEHVESHGSSKFVTQGWIERGSPKETFQHEQQPSTSRDYIDSHTVPTSVETVRHNAPYVHVDSHPTSSIQAPLAAQINAETEWWRRLNRSRNDPIIHENESFHDHWHGRLVSPQVDTGYTDQYVHVQSAVAPRHVEETVPKGPGISGIFSTKRGYGSESEDVAQKHRDFEAQWLDRVPATPFLVAHRAPYEPISQPPTHLRAPTHVIGPEPVFDATPAEEPVSLVGYREVESSSADEHALKTQSESEGSIGGKLRNWIERKRSTDAGFEDFWSYIGVPSDVQTMNHVDQYQHTFSEPAPIYVITTSEVEAPSKQVTKEKKGFGMFAFSPKTKTEEEPKPRSAEEFTGDFFIQPEYTYTTDLVSPSLEQVSESIKHVSPYASPAVVDVKSTETKSQSAVEKIGSLFGGLKEKSTHTIVFDDDWDSRVPAHVRFMEHRAPFELPHTAHMHVSPYGTLAHGVYRTAREVAAGEKAAEVAVDPRPVSYMSAESGDSVPSMVYVMQHVAPFIPVPESYSLVVSKDYVSKSTRQSITPPLDQINSVEEVQQIVLSQSQRVESDSEHEQTYRVLRPASEGPADPKPPAPLLPQRFFTEEQETSVSVREEVTPQSSLRRRSDGPADPKPPAPLVPQRIFTEDQETTVSVREEVTPQPSLWSTSSEEVPKAPIPMRLRQQADSFSDKHLSTVSAPVSEPGASDPFAELSPEERMEVLRLSYEDSDVTTASAPNLMDPETLARLQQMGVVHHSTPNVSMQDRAVRESNLISIHEEEEDGTHKRLSQVVYIEDVPDPDQSSPIAATLPQPTRPAGAMPEEVREVITQAYQEHEYKGLDASTPKPDRPASMSLDAWATQLAERATSFEELIPDTPTLQQQTSGGSLADGHPVQEALKKLNAERDRILSGDKGSAWYAERQDHGYSGSQFQPYDEYTNVQIRTTGLTEALLPPKAEDGRVYGGTTTSTTTTEQRIDDDGLLVETQYTETTVTSSESEPAVVYETQQTRRIGDSGQHSEGTPEQLSPEVEGVPRSAVGGAVRIEKVDSGYGTMHTSAFSPVSPNSGASSGPESMSPPGSGLSGRLDEEQLRTLRSFQEQLARQHEELAKMGFAVPKETWRP